MTTLRLLPIALAALFGVLIAAPIEAAIMEVARYEFTDDGSSSDTDSLTTASDYDVRTTEIGGSPSISNISGGGDNAFMRATTTPNSSSPAGDTNIHYHTFSLTVDSLPVGKSLNLTSLDFDYGPNTSASFSGSTFFLGIYSPTTGLVDTSDKLGGPVLNSGQNSVGTFDSIDLGRGNSVAGDNFKGVVNGETVELRIYFGDNSTSQSRIHRVDNVVLKAEIVPEPSSVLVLMSFPIAMLWRRSRS